MNCTRFHIVKHSPFAYNQLNKELKRKQGYIALVNGQKQSAGNIQVAYDSTKWVDTVSLMEQGVSTSEIDEIVIDKDLTSKAYRIGVSIVGGAFGGAFGGIIIGSTFANKTDGIDYYSKIGCFYGSMAGCIFGVVYQAIGGTTHRYHMKASETLSEKGL